jgi:hypothetical protein
MNFLQWLFARDAMHELDRWRQVTSEMQASFAGAHDVRFVLAQLVANVTRQPAVNGFPQASSDRVLSPRDTLAEVKRFVTRRREMREERRAAELAHDRRQVAQAMADAGKRAAAAEAEANTLRATLEFMTANTLTIAWPSGPDGQCYAVDSGGDVASGFLPGGGGPVMFTDPVEAVSAAMVNAFSGMPLESMRP